MSDDDLRAAVAASRSWRGVLRAVDRTSPRVGRDLKARCDALAIDYAHFVGACPDDEVLRAAVASATSWAEAVATIGYAPGSGSARARLRKRCAGLGIDTAHLAGAKASASPFELTPSLDNLRSAAPMLVAALLTLAGHRVSWPLEPAPYDLLTDGGADGVLRVQVKTTTRKQDGTWVCRLTHSTYDSALGRSVPDVYTSDEVDAFALVDGGLRVFLVPQAAVAGRTAIYVREYERFQLTVPLAA